MSSDHKKNILGILVDAVDYQYAVNVIIEAAVQRKPLSATALAVHGLMSGYFDPELKYRLNHMDLVVPDGQPIKWALNLLHKSNLSDRVYGPTLTLEVCKAAEESELPIYLFGCTPEILSRLSENLSRTFPKLKIAGMSPSLFRSLSFEEKSTLCKRISESGAALVFVGIGCPRQEVWAYEFREELNLPIVSVGAAFAFHAGSLRQAPSSMQAHGLEWLFRLALEPKRLWRRYILLNPAYLALLTLQILGKHFDTKGIVPVQELHFG